MSGSARAQKIAEELLGLDSASAPRYGAGARYSGATMDKVKAFYEAHKMPVMIVGAIVIVGAGYLVYKKVMKK